MGGFHGAALYGRADASADNVCANPDSALCGISIIYFMFPPFPHSPHEMPPAQFESYYTAVGPRDAPTIETYLGKWPGQLENAC